MLTKAALTETKQDLDRALCGGDPGEQRRAAAMLPLVEFALWSLAAIQTLATAAQVELPELPEGTASLDPADFAGGKDGNPAGQKLVAPEKLTKPRKSRGGK